MTGPGTLLLVIHAACLVSALLLPPTNIRISSRNFQHILTWDDPNNEPGTFYTVECQDSGSRVTPSRNCTRITSRQCDLTKDFTEPQETYTARVWSFTQSQKSSRSSSNVFTPISNTVLGPAQVDVVPGDHFISVSILPPVSHLWSETEQRNVTMLSDNVYPMLIYTIHLENGSEVQKFSTINETTHLTLPPNTNYCVSVSFFASQNSEDSIPSNKKCVVTGPTPQSVSRIVVIVPVVCGLLLLAGIVFLLIGLDRAGYICMKRKFFPKVLKSLPQSESKLSDANAYTPPPCVDHVEVMEKKVEVEEDKKEAKYQEGGYASRKKLMDRDTSGEANSGPTASVTSSSEASGRVTSSSDEEGVSVGPPEDVLDSDGSGASATPLLPHTIDSSSGQRFNNGGVFNVNLNSVSIASPADVWTDLKPGGAVPNKAGAPITTCPAAISLNVDTLICSPIDFGVLGTTVIDVGSCDDSDEEDLSDTCDDPPVSGYMSRVTS